MCPSLCVAGLQHPPDFCLGQPARCSARSGRNTTPPRDDRRHGYIGGTDISIVYLQNVSASIPSLAAGQVHASVLSPPATVMAESKGLQFLENVERAAAPCVLAMNGDFLAEHRVWCALPTRSA